MAEEQVALRADLPGLLILAADDAVLDYRLARDAASATRLVVLPRGGHQLHNTADYGEAAGAFLAALANEQSI